ncbi:MAG TPA: ABC-2 transporter permease [Ruminococcaceae bacterium]|nr:ABC-2 transporter permease [Oscillospiraceae bacterium]
MKGLILKDLFQYKSTLKSYIFILIFYSFFSVATKNSSFLAGMLILTASMLAITSFSYDERAKWDRYALTMPLSRDEIVLSKYLLSAILAFASSVAAVIACSLLDLFFNRLDIMLSLAVSAVCLEIALVYLFILLPIVFKIGVEKLRLIMMAVFFIPAIAVYIMVNLGMPTPDEQMLINLFKLSPAIVIAVGFISFLLSCKIYRAKEI